MVTKKTAELLRKIKACRDVLQAGNADAAVLAETAAELKGLLAELKSAENINNQSINNGGKPEMNEKLAIVAINKALRGKPLTDEEKSALQNAASSRGSRAKPRQKAVIWFRKNLWLRLSGWQTRMLV